MMNIGIPSSVVKVLRHRFDQQWTTRRNPAADDAEKMLMRVSDAAVALDARVTGSTVSFDDLLRLSEGDILTLDRAASQHVTLEANGVPAFRGKVMIAGRRKAVTIAGER
jgi:flagellar motor switch protein FliM